eukprot:COSAG05_NODE_6788_length_903_cov_1.019900_1_plen_168_part_10
MAATPPAEEACARVAAEILETERNYVASLRQLYEVYYRQLIITCYYPKDRRVVDLRVVLDLFSNVEDILLINDALLTELERNAENLQVSKLERALNIGTIFIKMGFALMLYRKYLANFSTAHRTLKMLEENKKFQAWIADTQAKNAEQLAQGGTSLASLLIKPVQRIP